MITIPAETASALVDTVHTFAGRQWCLATGGNFSVRLDDRHCLITRSGSDKRCLTGDDLMVCDLEGQALDADLQPSAETKLHTFLYRLEAGIGCVLHTHSVHSTVLSRSAGNQIEIQGYEMQKALHGNHSHLDKISIAVIDNDQDMSKLATAVADQLNNQPGFLLRGHGLYAWGRDIDEARRHVEGLEFLFACLWQEKLAGLR